MAQNKKNGTKSAKLRGISKEIHSFLCQKKEGAKATEIQQFLHRPRRTIYNGLKKLIEQKLIKKRKKTFFLCQIQSTPLKMAQNVQKSGTKLVQLHNLSFVIRLDKKPEWWGERHNRMLKYRWFADASGVKQINWGNNSYTQAFWGKFVVQAHNQSLIFIASEPYWGRDAYDCFDQGVRDFLKVYDYVEKVFEFRFFRDGVPQASVRSQHYVHLRDAVAERCKKEGDRFEVRIGGKRRMWVDLSEPVGVEAGHKDYAPEDMYRYQSFVADVIVKNPPKPSLMARRHELLLEAVEGHSKNWDYYADNMRSHVKAIQKLGKGVDELIKTIKKSRKK